MPKGGEIKEEPENQQISEQTGEPEAKEEHIEVWISENEGQLVVKQESNTSLLTPVHQEILHDVPKGSLVIETKDVLETVQTKDEPEDPEPMKIKKDLEPVKIEYFCTHQDEEQLVVKQETDRIMLTHFNEQKLGNGTETNKNLLLSANHHNTENQHQQGDDQNDSGSRKDKDDRDNPALKRHTKDLAFHRSDKPFSCDQCDKSFSLQRSLNEHRTTHTVAKTMSHHKDWLGSPLPHHPRSSHLRLLRHVDTSMAWTPLMLFQLFFSSSVVRTIIDNTNANAARRKAAGMVFKWSVLTVKDFYKFLSILLFTGLVSLPQRCDFWRTKWPYDFPFPGETMTRDRFEAIVWSLHISNPNGDEENEKKNHQPGYDRLHKIKPLYTEITAACKSFFHPYQDISIEEQMVATKDRISMKQYMKEKPKKWGYKLFVLSDAKTGYTWNFFVYTGKLLSPQSPLHGLSCTSVMDLLPFSYLGKGYRLYMDNFYTSPALLTDLYAKNIGACGTVRKNRLGFPKTQNNDLPKNARRGDMRWIRNEKILFVKWMDTREVTMCSTIHKADSGKTVKIKVKEAGVWQTKDIPVPDCIVDYNTTLGGVDLSNALIGYYSVKKTKKWYKKFFNHFVDLAVVNRFIFYKELFKIREGTVKKTITQKVFREQLAWEMLKFAEASEASSPTSTASPPSSSSASYAASPRPTSICMPAVYQGEGRVRKHCKNCANSGIQRVKTSYYCSKYLVPLCLTSSKNCFFEYHNGQP